MNFGVNSKLMFYDAASLHAVLPLLFSPPPLSSFGIEHNFYNSLLLPSIRSGAWEGRRLRQVNENSWKMALCGARALTTRIP